MSRPSKRYRPDNSDVSPSQQVVRNMKEQLTRAFAMISCLQREKEAIQKQLLKQQPAMDVATLLKNQRRNFHSWSVVIVLQGANAVLYAHHFRTATGTR
eukprot:m.126137 g.126137  ORF g.126137 m.126137 type:complete len:99 (-) comp9702_c0_seq3:2642-2938(-)